jgi:hypothetical protein
MKYYLDVVIRDSDFKPYQNVELEFDERYSAVEELDKITDNIPEGCHITYSKITPVVKCSCGVKVLCSDFTNTCDRCGADYNFNGDLLAPRSQWGEETGEHWTECY